MTAHEDRFVQIMAVAIPDFLVEQELTIPRKARHLDLVAAMGTPPRLFGALKDVCANRCVLFEHESTRLRTHRAAAAVFGQAWLVWKRLTPQSKNPLPWLVATERPPIVVVIAESVSANVRAIVPNLEARPEPGLFATSDLDRGGVVLISVRDLAPGTEMDFWAWTGSARNVQHARDRLNRLLDNPKIPTLERAKIMEAVMEERIAATDAERESTYQRLQREFREQGREEGRRAVLLKLLGALAPERVARLSKVEDLEALEAEVMTVMTEGRSHAGRSE